MTCCSAALPYLHGCWLAAGLVVGGVKEPDRGDDLKRANGSVQQVVQPQGEGEMS